jgi:2-aminoadipate transaminase
MAAALARHLPAGCEWQLPRGGMFFWVRLPAGCDALALLPQAVAAGVAFVPGAAFYARVPDVRTMRLSFVTLSGEQIEAGVAALGRLLVRVVDKESLESAP